MDIDAKSKGRAAPSPRDDIFVVRRTIKNGDFSSQKRGSFGALASTFEQCDFASMCPDQMVFASGAEQTRYIECRFDGSRFRKIIVGQAYFERCTFLNVEMNRLLSHAAEFLDCDFSGSLKSSVFYGRVVGNHAGATTRLRNEFRGNDFSKMRLIDVGFRGGIDLSLQRLPVGDDYLYLKNAAISLGILRDRYLQTTSSSAREAVFRFLQLPEELVREGQAQLFLCKSSEPFLTADKLDLIWKELREIDAGEVA